MIHSGIPHPWAAERKFPLNSSGDRRHSLARERDQFENAMSCRLEIDTICPRIFGGSQFVLLFYFLLIFIYLFILFLRKLVTQKKVSVVDVQMENQKKLSSYFIRKALFCYLIRHMCLIKQPLYRQFNHSVTFACYILEQI